MKKFSLIVLSMIMTLLPVFASDTLIRWDWVLNDSRVQYFRYQVDGTDPASWSVVDGSVSYFETTALDPSVDHTLYLECSYDGIYWSETSSSVAYAIPQVEDTAVTEPVLEEVVLSPAEEPAVVVIPEEPAVEPKEKVNAFTFSLLFKNGFISSSSISPFKLSFVPEIDLGLGLDFSNIIRLGQSAGIGFRTDFDFVAVPVTGYFGHVFDGTYVFKNSSYQGYKGDVTGYLTLTARAGFAAFNMGLGGGASFGYGSGDEENQFSSVTLFDKMFSIGTYGALNAGMRFYLGPVFSVGVEGSARIMLPNWESIRYSADLVLGFSF